MKILTGELKLTSRVLHSSVSHCRDVPTMSDTSLELKEDVCVWGGGGGGGGIDMIHDTQVEANE